MCLRLHPGPSLKVVSTLSAGYEHIDLQACHRRGVLVGHALGATTDATAELAVAILLATSRRLFEGNLMDGNMYYNPHAWRFNWQVPV